MIKIIADPAISQEEVEAIIAEEKVLYSNIGKKLAEVNLTLENDEIIIKSYAASPIKRIRRIPGYLSEEHNFNDAKQDELRDRITHVN